MGTTNCNGFKTDVTPIADSGSLITSGGVKDYVDSELSAINSGLAEKSERTTYSATISTSWSGSIAPYTQTVAISGILATDTPHITPVYSNDNAVAVLEQEAWNMISKAITADGSLVFTCFSDKPTQAVAIQIEVIK